MKTVVFNVSEKLQQIVIDKPITILYGGKMAGKTYYLLQQLVLQGLQGKNSIVVVNDMVEIDFRLYILDEILNDISYSIVMNVKNSRGYMFKNGAKIQFVTKDRLRNCFFFVQRYDYCLFYDAGQFKPRYFYEVKQELTRRNKDLKVLIDLTIDETVDMNHWIFEYFFYKYWYLDQLADGSHFEMKPRFKFLYKEFNNTRIYHVTMFDLPELLRNNMIERTRVERIKKEELDVYEKSILGLIDVDEWTKYNKELLNLQTDKHYIQYKENLDY